MSSRSKVMKKHFTNEQLNWLASTYPDYKAPESDAEAVRDAARLLMVGKQFAGANQEQKTENMAKLAKLMLGKDLVTLKDAAAKVGYTGKDAESEFRDAYFSKDTDNATKAAWYAVMNDAYGDNGWDLVKKELQKSELEKMNKDIATRRKNIMEGYDEEGKEAQVIPWVQSALMGMAMPRQKQAYIEGRDPTTGEILMDSFSNAAYAMPVGGIEKAIVSKVGQNMAGRVAGAVGSNMVAPAAVTAGDVALGGKDYANWKDAAIDVGLGLATNLGVNKGISAMAARGLGLLQGDVKSAKVTAIQNMLLGKPSERELALKYIDEATERARRATLSKKALDEKAKDQLLDDLEVAEFGRMLRSGENDYLGQNIAAANLRASEPNIAAGKLIGEEPLWQIDLESALKNQRSPESILEDKVVGDNWIGKAPPKPDDNLATFLADVPGPDYINREVLRNHPELEIAALPVDERKELVKQALIAAKNYGVNKFGSDKDASRLLQVFPLPYNLNDLRKKQKEWRDEQAKQEKIDKQRSKLLTLFELQKWGN